jgi:phosphotransferase system enzyme I (PtsP)
MSDPGTHKKGRQEHKNRLKGIPVSAGFGQGYVYYLREGIGFDEIYFREASNVHEEIDRFEDAVRQSESQVLQVCHPVETELSRDEQAILQAYLMFLRDGGLKNKVIDNIREGHAAEYALKEVILNYVKAFSKIEDPYIRQRDTDIENIGKRILRNLLGLEDEETSVFKRDTILIASNLSPAELIRTRQENLRGIILSKGGETSHVSILARSFEIPMVINVRGLSENIKENDFLIVDGTSGLVYPKPSKVVIQEYQRLEKEKSRQDKSLDALKVLPAQTRDGFKVRLGANIGILSDLSLVEKYGVDHIGLYRTEFLFLTRDSFPSEDEQANLYRRILEEAGGKEVTIRTLDVGGDKFLSYLEYPKEDNPYLGWRSIRVSLELKDIFRDQIRAILKASAFGRTKLLFPMISSVGEMKEIIAMISEEKANLRAENIPHDDEIKIGILVEVPAAAIILDKLLPYVDFISVGTNDLVQYVLAVDRNNPKVASIYNPLHPAVISVISEAASLCRKSKKPLVICGEAAASPRCAYLYVGMGINDLSMNAASVPVIKNLIRKINQKDAKRVLKQVLSMEDADSIGNFLDNILP